jgi:hypothetical protein
MPDNITVASVQQYKANVELLLQQQDSRLAGKVIDRFVHRQGRERRRAVRLATAQQKTSRHSDTPLLDSRRTSVGSSRSTTSGPR